MELESYVKRHFCNYLFSELLNPDVAGLIISYLPLKPNQYNQNGEKDGVWKDYYHENGQLKY